MIMAATLVLAPLGRTEYVGGIAFVACLLLIAQLHQVWSVEPPGAARFESDFGFRPQLIPGTGQTIHINLPTDRRPEPATSRLVTQVSAVPIERVVGDLSGTARAVSTEIDSLRKQA
jgi:hypothetical protein